MSKVEMLIYNGPIITMDSKNSVKDWICVDRGKIIGLGVSDGYKDYLEGALEVINLEGKSVLPGFYDSHINLCKAGINTFGINLSMLKTLDGVLNAIKEAADKTPPGEPIMGIGLYISQIEEKRLPDRHELDICAPNNPVWIDSADYHTCAVNSLMLYKIRLPLNIEGIIRDSNNIPNGCFIGNANVLVTKSILLNFNDIRKAQGIDRVIKHAVENGVTSAVSFEGAFASNENFAEFILKNKDTFPIDVELFFQTVNIRKAEQNGIRKIGDLFIDGTFSTRTAAISFNYLDGNGTNGVLYFTQNEVNEFFLKAHKNEMQLAVHCIGDRAIEQVINAYEYIQSKYPRSDHRHRIEHCELFRDDLIARASALNLVVSMQPMGEYNWGGTGKMYEERLGQAHKQTNPFKKIIQSGIKIAGGSDFDVLPLDPICNIHMAVNHPVLESRVNIEEAIRMYTINGAYSIFEEKEKGSLEIGKKGDFVIVDKNPLSVKKDEIKDIKVIATIKEGHTLFMK